MKGIVLGTLITVFTSTQLLASSPVLPPFSGITQSTTHAITIDNNSDSQFQLTLSPGGAYDVLPNYGYQIPVAPNTQYNLAAVNAVQTTSTATPRVDYSETTEALPFSAAPTSLAQQVASGVVTEPPQTNFGLYSWLTSGQTYSLSIGTYGGNTLVFENLSVWSACVTASGLGAVLVWLKDATLDKAIAFSVFLVQAGTVATASFTNLNMIRAITSLGAQKGDSLAILVGPSDLQGSNQYAVSLGIAWSST